MDINKILKSHTDENGNINADKLNEVAKEINSAVGTEFVAKKRYDEKLAEIDSLKDEKQNAEDKVTSAEKWKTKYDAIKEDFEAYKKDISAKETKAARESAYAELLKEAGVSEKRFGAILKITDVSSFEMGDDGKFKDADKLIESIKEDWSDFIVTTETKGAETSTPPSNNGGSAMTKDEIMAITDATERQEAIAENHELFGF